MSPVEVLRKSYQLQLDSEQFSLLPSIQSIIKNVQVFCRILISSPDADPHLKENAIRLTNHLIKLLGAQQHPQAIGLMGELIDEYIFPKLVGPILEISSDLGLHPNYSFSSVSSHESGQTNRKICSNRSNIGLKLLGNVKLRRQLMEFFKFYIWLADKELDSQSVDNKLLITKEEKEITARDFFKPKSQGPSTSISKTILRIKKLLTIISHHPLTIPPFDIEVLTTIPSLSRNAIFAIDPQTQYLIEAIRFKYSFEGVSVQDIKYSIDRFFELIKWEDWLKLEYKLIESGVISKKQINIEITEDAKDSISSLQLSKLSITSTSQLNSNNESLYDYYSGEKVQGLYNLWKFYCCDLTFFEMESTKRDHDHEIILRNARGSIENNILFARDRRPLLNELTKTIEKFKAKKNDLIKKQEQSNEHDINYSKTIKYKVKPKEKSIIETKKEFINEKKLEVYKKFSEKHPHILMDNKLSDLLSSESNDKTVVPQDKPKNKEFNSLVNNLKVIVNYKLFTGPNKYKALIYAFIINVIMIASYFVAKKLGFKKVKSWWVNILKTLS